MLKLYKIMFFNSMILGTMISISAYNWLGMWMGLEINLLSIIPLLNLTKNMYESEASMKYFITQALASLILIFSIIMMLSLTEFISPKMNSFFMMILNSLLLMKMGAAPLHFWFPEIMEGLIWFNCFIMLTWQKIAPMILLMNNYLYIKFLMIPIIMSLVISTLMGFNQTSLQKILTFSSINHISWMLSAMMISFSFWLIYFIIYTITTFNIIVLFKINNSFQIKQLINSMNLNKLFKFTLILNFFSLSGLPPFLGFLPKWLIINWLSMNNFFLLSFLLIIMTLIMIFIYIRMMFPSLMMSHSENMNTLKFKNYVLILMNLISLFSLIFFSLMNNFM